MPRLVHPTPFTAMATQVAQNPRIICATNSSATGPISVSVPDSGRYVRDPDDEDTLSPVMVPIASPDSCGGGFNNNFHDSPAEPPPKPAPAKRPRSPVAVPNHHHHTIRAISPGIRPRGPQTPVRPPTNQQQHRIRVRAPTVVHQGPRGPPIRPSAPYNNNNAVQIRPPPISKPQVVVNKERQAAVQAVAKSLPGKANVIVLHKNSPMAKSIAAVRVK